MPSQGSAFIKRGQETGLDSSDSASPDYEFVSALDERGRVIVPAFLRRRLSLKFGSKVLVSVRAAKDSGSEKNKKGDSFAKRNYDR